MATKAKETILATPKADIGINWITKYFSKHMDKSTGKVIPPIFDVREKIHLSAGEYINKTDIDTTVGSLLFNKLLVEKWLEKVIPGGYHNQEMTKKNMEKFFDMVALALRTDKITVDTLCEFLHAYEFFGLKATAIFSPSFTMNIIKPNEKVMKEKERLISEAKDLTDLNTMIDIEDKLVDFARKELKNDPGIGLYDSGARGSFDDSYKTTAIMVGPRKNLRTGKFEFIESNYMDGIDKKDIRSAGDGVVLASYPKAVGTADAGYITKQFYAVFQSLIIDKNINDCGSKEGIEIVLTNDNYTPFIDQNVYTTDPQKYTTLTEANKNKFIGKKVKVRSPMFCISKNICLACAGQRYPKNNIYNLGLTLGKIPNTMLNKGMKQFHVSKIQLNKANIDELLL